jgi:penicillin-binding protein 2
LDPKKTLARPSGAPLPYERVDHAWFVGFAPAAKPRIAFAVLVEHGGHGGSVAAPVAVEIVENYFGAGVGARGWCQHFPAPIV